MIELSRTRHTAEQYQKQLIAQDSSHKELVDLLKNTQSNIVDELTKEGGVLARVLNSESSTLAK
jgi:hypothetical protein